MISVIQNASLYLSFYVVHLTRVIVDRYTGAAPFATPNAVLAVPPERAAVNVRFVRVLHWLLSRTS